MEDGEQQQSGSKPTKLAAADADKDTDFVQKRNSMNGHEQEGARGHRVAQYSRENITMGEKLRIVSWNINGIRTFDMKDMVKKTFKDCTVLAVQETKISRDTLTSEQALLPCYSSYFSYNKEKAGYAGVASFVHDKLHVAFVEEGSISRTKIIDYSEVKVKQTREEPGHNEEDENELEETSQTQRGSIFPPMDSLWTERVFQTEKYTQTDASDLIILNNTLEHVQLVEERRLADDDNQRKVDSPTEIYLSLGFGLDDQSIRINHVPFLENEVHLVDPPAPKPKVYDGRTIVTYHTVEIPSGKLKQLVIFNVYCPRWRNEQEGDNTKEKLAFHEQLLEEMEKLYKANCFVLLVGDLNVSHKLLDQSDVTDVKKFPTNPFREWMDNMLKDGQFVDTFRNFYPDAKDQFTCWNTRTNARQNNFGTRLDYIIADQQLMEHVETSEIHPDIFGSDHCPVSITLSNLIFHPGRGGTSDRGLCTKFYREFAGKQADLSKYLWKKAPPTKSNLNEIPIVEVTAPTSTNTNNPSTSTKASAICRRTTSKRTMYPRQAKLTNFFTKRARIEIETEDENGDASGNVATETEKQGDAPKQSTSTEFYKELNSQSAKDWKTMLTGPKTPKCIGHAENCVLRTVKKKGQNYGRQFWACPRGSGRPGEIAANCNFFKWINDKS